MSKYWVEGYPDLNYGQVFHGKEEHSLSYHVPKVPKNKKKIVKTDFNQKMIFLVKLINFRKETLIKYLNIFADFESCMMYGDFGTWVIVGGQSDLLVQSFFQTCSQLLGEYLAALLSIWCGSSDILDSAWPRAEGWIAALY